MSDLGVSLPSDVLAAAERMSKKNLQFALDESIPTSHRPVSTINVAVGPDTVQNVVIGAGSGTSLLPNWQINVPPGFILDSNIQIRLPFKFKFKGTTNAANMRVLPKYQWAMSRYAIYQAIKNISVTLDGTTLTKQIGAIMPLIADYTDLEDPRSHDMYSCPDTVHSFADLYEVSDDAARNNMLTGAGASPFAVSAYSNSKFGSRAPVVVATDDSATGAAGQKTAQYSIDVFMALPWSIFASSGTGLGLGNLRQARVSLTLDTEWNRLFNYLPILTGYTAPNFPECTSAVMRESPEIYCRFTKPADYVAAGLRDPSTGLPYSQIHTLKQHSHFTTQYDLAAGQSRMLQSGSIVLSSVPKRIFIAAVRSRTRDRKGVGGTNAMTTKEICNTPSTYASLSNVKISIGGHDANNSMSQFSLYEMSTRNGYNLPWSIASSVGYAVCFDLHNDLSLGSNNILSSVSNLPMSVSATAHNKTGVRADFDFVVVVENDSYLEFKANGIVGITDAIQLDEEDKAALLKIGSHIIRTSSNTIGGSFFGTIFRGAKKVLSGLPKLAWDNKGKIFDYVKSSLASGFRPNTIGGADALPQTTKNAKAKKGAGVEQSKSSSRIL